jgi:hypothetical protein
MNAFVSLCSSCMFYGNCLIRGYEGKIIDQWNWPPLGGNIRGLIRLRYHSESDYCTADFSVPSPREYAVHIRIHAP